MSTEPQTDYDGIRWLLDEWERRGGAARSADKLLDTLSTAGVSLPAATKHAVQRLSAPRHEVSVRGLDSAEQ